MRLLLPCALAAAMVAGCAPARGDYVDRGPQAMAATALQKAVSLPASFTLHAGLQVNTQAMHDVRAADMASYGVFMQGATVDAEGEVESSRRAAVTVHLASPCAGTVQFATYDGATYVSPDGNQWAPTKDPSSALVAAGLTPGGDVYTELQSGLRDVGARQFEGTDAEQLHADASPVAIRALLKHLGPYGVVANEVEPRGGAIDIYVRHADGGLAGIDFSATADLDFGRLAAAIGSPVRPGSGVPSGNLLMVLDAHLRMTSAPSLVISAPSPVAGAPLITDVCSLAVAGALPPLRP